MAIEHALNRVGINFLRTDIGDKYVLAKLVEKGLSLGGEQSGHIILKDLHSTGDGILTAIAVADMMVESGKSLSELFDVELYPQVNINLPVSDKLKIMNSQILSHEITHLQGLLGEKGRIMVRASGTEPKIRIMVESEDKALNQEYAEILVSAVKKADEKI